MDNKVEDKNHVNISEAQGNICVYIFQVSELCLFSDDTKTKPSIFYIQISIIFFTYMTLPLFSIRASFWEALG